MEGNIYPLDNRYSVSYGDGIVLIDRKTGQWVSISPQLAKILTNMAELSRELTEQGAQMVTVTVSLELPELGECFLEFKEEGGKEATSATPTGEVPKSPLS